jgi:hypothetical protein
VIRLHDITFTFLRGHQRLALGALMSACMLVMLSGCVVPPPAPASSAPTPEQIAKQERLDRANANLAEGLKSYDAGSYEPAMKSFLVALDSGQLTVTQQINARKHMAFIHCVSSREVNCREEFEKSFALDPKFDLSPAEAGHPIWGAMFRSVKTDIDTRRSGRPAPAPAPKVLTTGEKLLADGVAMYDDGIFAKSVALLQDAIKETLSTADQVKARKYIAFGLCLTTRMVLCRQEFERILALQPDFDLTPAEAGHPSWGPSFRAAKTRAKTVPPSPPKK